MSWNGYFVLDGQEIINAPRTEAYAEAAGAFWLRAQYKNDDLAPMLGQTPYTTPGLDAAPWVDPDVPESLDFWGYYPLDVDGIENSSRGSTPIEYTIDGGTAGRIRHATKSVVFNGVLVGANEKAVAYGAMWLRRVLLGDRCNNPTLDHGIGTDLGYLSSEPRMDDNPNTGPTESLIPLRRMLRRFVVNVGPDVTARRTIESCGGAVWSVTFTGVAGVPWQFGAERPVLQGYLDPVVTDPWVPGVTPGTITTGGFRETECGEDTWAPIFDPLCPPLVNPPAPPSIPLGCFNLPQPTEAIIATNYDTNPSVEVNATNWAVPAGFGTGARLASAGAEVGSYVYRATVGATPPPGTTSWALQRYTTTRIPADVGQTVGVYIRARVDVGETRTIQLRLRAYSGSTAASNAGFATANITVTEDWQEFLVSGVLPAGNDGFALLASPTVVGEWSPGDWIEWDAAYAWKDVDPGFDSYFDGNTPDDETAGLTYEWTGTEHASTSTTTGIDPEWDRRTVVIPESVVPLWGSVAPIITLYAPEEVRGARLRFYPDPDGTLDPDTNPCSFAVDLLVSYIPAEATLILDSGIQQVWVQTVNGQRRRADSLVFTTEGEPFDWPDLSCGYQHVLTVDTEAGTTPPYLDLSLVPKAV